MKGIRHFTSSGKTIAWLLVLCFAIAGCMQYSFVNAGKDVKVGLAFTVDTPINWSKSKKNNVETWTIDGPKLQRLIFFQGIEDGKPLFPPQFRSKEKEMPVYRSGMNSLEIKEFIEASLARSGGHQIVTRDLRPATLGKLGAFRFEFSYFIESGLKYDGFVVGAKKQDKLLAIMYVGTALYHYKKYLNDAEKVVSSVIVL